MRAIKDLNDVQIVLKDLDNFKSKWEAKVWDLSGRQIKNGGIGTDPNDFVVLRQIGPSASTEQATIGKGPAIPISRTLLIKDTTIRNDAADHVVIFGNGGPYLARFFFGVLRKTITSNLTIRVHHVLNGVDRVLGIFTIPSTQAIDMPVKFTITDSLIEGAVLTWDILASDGSQDGDGIASFTIVWF